MSNSLFSVGGQGPPGSGKDPVRVATTANITLSGEQTLDGVLTSVDRVLVNHVEPAACAQVHDQVTQRHVMLDECCRLQARVVLVPDTGDLIRLLACF